MLHISAYDAAFGVAHEQYYFVAFFGGRQFGLDTLYGVADVHARKVQVAVSVLYFADYIVREIAAAKSY